MTATPYELRLAEQRYDAQLDCTPEELAGRKRQRAEDAKWRESVRRHHRYETLVAAVAGEPDKLTSAIAVTHG